MLTALLSAMMLTASPEPQGATPASPGLWAADAARSRITVHVFKKGLFSGLAHDHHFVPGRWHATAIFDDASPSSTHVEVIVAADSLGDEQPALSPKDREKVDRQAAGPEVLDAQRHPQIRFVSNALQPTRETPGRPDDGIRGALTGTLSFHGQERPLSIPLVATKEGNGWRARGAVTFKQSDFGIRPFSGFAGTIAVRDELKLEYDLLLVPTS